MSLHLTSRPPTTRRRLPGGYCRLSGVVLLAIVCCVFGACGVTSGNSGSNSQGNVGTHASPTPRAHSTPSSSPGATSCPGGSSGTISSAGTPSVVVNGGLPDRSASAHVGDLIQVRLPATFHWSYHAAAPAPELLQPAGYEDKGQKVCIWNFRAHSAGTYALRFAGAPICDPKGPCPLVISVSTITLHIV